eukprot:TRINITY_DN22456_c1_g1_i1.p1 TRINITY_DN22456_c1_g1~~TRINITY_DN22456_c1_g1_i1.p1  ORF type:complete len:689 (-),score=92.71 TRINITY_DN22456_c1_g1_i1:76-2142(-)
MTWSQVPWGIARLLAACWSMSSALSAPGDVSLSRACNEGFADDHCHLPLLMGQEEQEDAAACAKHGVPCPHGNHLLQANAQKIPRRLEAPGATRWLANHGPAAIKFYSLGSGTLDLHRGEMHLAVGKAKTKTLICIISVGILVAVLVSVTCWPQAAGKDASFGAKTEVDSPAPAAAALPRTPGTPGGHGAPIGSPTLWREILYLLSIGIPLGLSNASRQLQDASNDIMLGHKNTVFLAGVAQAGIWTGLIDTMAGSGIQQLSMLCGQAFGAKQHHLVGAWLQMFLVLFTALFPISAGMRFLTKPILLLVGESAELAEAAGTYALWSAPCFLAEAWYLCVKEYYASQGIVGPALIVDVIFLFANFGSVYIFVFLLDFGIIGAALSSTFIRFARTLVYTVYCYCRGYHEATWHGWSYNDIANRERWMTVLSLTLPGAIGGLFETLVFSCSSLFAGQMGASQSAGFSLLMMVCLICLTFSSALADSTGIRMSHHLGANEPENAKYTTQVGIAFCIGMNFTAGLIFQVFAHHFAQFMSSDPVVQETIYDLRLQIAISTTFLGGLSGSVVVLMKQGRAWLVAAIIPLCTWLLGLPLIFICSNHFGLQGIFMGLNAGYGLATVSLIVAYLKSDWPQLCIEAHKRAELDSSPEDVGMLIPAKVASSSFLRQPSFASSVHSFSPTGSPIHNWGNDQ